MRKDAITEPAGPNSNIEYFGKRKRSPEPPMNSKHTADMSGLVGGKGPFDRSA